MWWIDLVRSITCRSSICYWFSHACWSLNSHVFRPMWSDTPRTIQRHCSSTSERCHWQVKVFWRHSNPNDLEHSGAHGILGFPRMGPRQFTSWHVGSRNALRIPSYGRIVYNKWICHDEQIHTYPETVETGLTLFMMRHRRIGRAAERRIHMRQLRSYIYRYKERTMRGAVEHMHDKLMIFREAMKTAWRSVLCKYLHCFP